MGLQTIPADPLTPYQLSNDVYNSIFAPSDQQSWYGNLKKYSVLNENETNGSSIIRLKGSVDFKDQWNGGRAEKMDGSELLSGGALEQLKTLRPLETDSSTRKLWINRDCKEQSGQYYFTEDQNLKIITPDYLADTNQARCNNNSSLKDQYAGYLMNLLGYQVDPQLVNANLMAQSEPLWQLGCHYTQRL
jgi:type IV pilus assembly protein PilY1